MYHFDIPQALHYIGDFNNDKLVEYMVDYADVLFSLFGDRVKTWITVNEPIAVCALLPLAEFTYYGTIIPPGVSEYLCGHNIIKAHARIYRLYQYKYKHSQRGEQNYDLFCRNNIIGIFGGIFMRIICSFFLYTCCFS